MILGFPDSKLDLLFYAKNTSIKDGCGIFVNQCYHLGSKSLIVKECYRNTGISREIVVNTTTHSGVTFFKMLFQR